MFLFFADFRLKIFLQMFLDYSARHFCFRIYLLPDWCLLSNFGAGLRALKPDITHITSCRYIISIELT